MRFVEEFYWNFGGVSEGILQDVSAIIQAEISREIFHAFKNKIINPMISYFVSMSGVGSHVTFLVK